MDSQLSTSKIDPSDSAYSKSCTNSNSRRSASLKSHPSRSNSSKTSGYEGATNGAADILDAQNNSTIKRNQEKDYKKKKFNAANCNGASSGGTATHLAFAENCANHLAGEELLPDENSGGLANDVVMEDLHNRNFSTFQGEAPAKDTISAGADNFEFVGEAPENKNANETSPAPLCVERVQSINKINTPQSEDGFCCVISMSNGLVLYVSPNMTNILGFPKHMWMGRSFTEFLHPKDREAFSSQITTGVTVPLIDAMGKRRDVKSSLYVYLRKYKGLKTFGYGVVERALAYQAFHLSITFKNSAEYLECVDLFDNGDLFLAIVAVPVYSLYRAPNEMKKSKNFVMRHTSECTFIHVDDDVVMNFGYFPQDMLGKSVFDFYHPEDMPLMKEIYESVIKSCQVAGAVYRSKPYRFVAKNGTFVTVESKWSCFINPWSRRFEFITGNYNVLQGPTNPDVFEENDPEVLKSVPQQVLLKAKAIQTDILYLLKKKLNKPSELNKCNASIKCKNLASVMENIMSDVLQSESRRISLSEKDSAVFGEISPHHDYYDRESVSESPPSYNQMNYQENLQRFFKSEPMTADSENGEIKPIQNLTDSDQEIKMMPEHRLSNEKWLSPIQNSIASGTGSAENLSSESLLQMESINATSVTNSSIDSYKHPHLTEELLIRHNVDMEKIMRQKHRKQRINNKKKRKTRKAVKQNINVFEKNDADNREKLLPQGVKRSVSLSWDGDAQKVSKCKWENELVDSSSKTKLDTFEKIENSNSRMENAVVSDNGCISKAKNINLWPPFSVSVTSLGNNQTSYGINSTVHPVGNYSTGMFPIYYLPAQQGHNLPECNASNRSSHLQVQYVPGMMYNCGPMFSTPSSMLCSPIAMLPYSVPQTISPVVLEQKQKSCATCVVTTVNEVRPAFELQRSTSQATSVKAEPGSALGSVVSASGFNQAASECSRKDYCLLSACSPDFPLVSPPEGAEEGRAADCNISSQNNLKTETFCPPNLPRQDEESSYSSFYSSFLKTDTGSGSNDDSISTGKTRTKRYNEKYAKPVSQPRKRCNPPWLEAVTVTSDLVYRYQIAAKNLEDILESDLKTLENMEQPLTVNNQLDQLYLEMELAGLSTKLTLDEGITSSSSSSQADSEVNASSSKVKKSKRSRSCLAMIYEENCPFPSPQTNNFLRDCPSSK